MSIHCRFIAATEGILFCFADVGKVGALRDLFAARALCSSASVLIFVDRRASRRDIEMHTAAMSM
jgi:hypothetical protein